MSIVRGFLALLLYLVAQVASAAEGPREVYLLAEGWRFLKGDTPGAQLPAFDDRAWRTVSVPHDYSIEGPVQLSHPSGPAGGFFPGGVAWYRMTVTLPRIDPYRRHYAVFDGVMANSEVWINGQPLGRRPSGHASFIYELTPYLKAGYNLIAVRCNNALEPSQRWYLGGGIYRQVRLVSTSRTHIEPWGSFITTPEVSADVARVRIRSSVTPLDTGRLQLVVRLRDPAGELAATMASALTDARPGQPATLQAEADVRAPQRWNVDRPALYKAEITLLRNGTLVDNDDIHVGIRSFKFEPEQGFSLNGRPLALRGVALHTDAGALGAAVPLSAWQRRLAALRSLGVNAIRTAHNAVAPEFLDLCDRMGFLVMNEFRMRPAR